jgi:Putative Flp pilus-assembly TadE/G-like
MRRRSFLSSNQGVIAIGFALLWVALLGFVAMVIDLGFALVTRNQLQNITDGASLAGTRQLGRIYEGLTPAEQQGYLLTGADQGAILAEVHAIGAANVAGGMAIYINAEDVVIGQWDGAMRQLTPTVSAPNAVQVLARRDDQANSPLTTSFARVVGTDSLKVWAQATASLTGISKVMAGELDAPVGVSRAWFETYGGFCGESIQFFPVNTPESCAGWHTFLDASSSLPDILAGLHTGAFTSPEAQAGSTQFSFADVSQASAEETVQAFQALYEDQSICSTTGSQCHTGGCSGSCEWRVLVAVYDFPNCSAPPTAVTIAGFATAIFDQVQVVPETLITGRIECGMVQANARGGGPHFGTKGSIPGLVQ